MKNTKKYSSNNSSAQLKKYKVIFIAAIAIILIGTFYTSITKPVGINLIESQSPVTLKGVLIKDTPTGVKGNYYLLNLSGNSIRLSTSDNLDSFEGQQVEVTGLLDATDEASTQSLTLTKLEILSTQ